MQSGKILEILNQLVPEILSLPESIYKQQLYVKATEAGTWAMALQQMERGALLKPASEEEKKIILNSNLRG